MDAMMTKSGQISAGKILTYAVLCGIAVFMLFPFLWMVTTAIKPLSHTFTWPPQLIPRPLALSNITEAWAQADFTRALWNSLVVAGGTTLLALFLNSLAGFGFAKYQFWGRDVLFGLVLATLIIPFQVIMVPLFITMRNLHLLDTYTGLIVPRVADAFGVFLVRQYLQTVPNELIEAARIDGASEFGIYWRIIIPLIKPALAVIAILLFQWRWNDLIWPLIVITSEEMKTVQLVLATFQGEYYIEWHYLMALSTLSLVPMLLVFIRFQRYFVQGITLSGLKG